MPLRPPEGDRHAGVSQPVTQRAVARNGQATMAARPSEVRPWFMETTVLAGRCRELRLQPRLLIHQQVLEHTLFEYQQSADVIGPHDEPLSKRLNILV